MTKKLTYKQTIELILNHLKATKRQWRGGSYESAIRRPHYYAKGKDMFSGREEYGTIYCCPISSLVNACSTEFETVARTFKLDKKAMSDIVDAADNDIYTMRAEKEFPFSKAVKDLRVRMDRIFKS